MKNCRKELIIDNLIIRRFTLHDAKIVSRLITDNLEHVNSKDYNQKVINYMKKVYSYDNILELDKEQDIYIVEYQGDIIGTGSLKNNDIRTIFIDMNYHGCGIGQVIMKYLEEKMNTNQYNNITLSSSITAIDFYKKLGYVAIEEIVSEKKGNAYKMIKKISL